MKKGLFVLLSCFSMVVFSGDIGLETQLACLSGKPTGKMIKSGTYRTVLGCYVKPAHMFDGDPEHGGRLGLLQNEIDKLDADLDLGVGEFSMTIGETVSSIEKLFQDEERLGYSCLPVDTAEALNALLENQRKILLTELASHPAFNNHILGLQFKIEELSEPE